MIFYCPSCWAEVARAHKACPACGADLQNLSEESYEEKLIRALRHPEPATPVRAAAILGELRSNAAVLPLMERAEHTEDPYLQEAIAQALGTIGHERATTCLKRLKRDGALRVRIAAARALDLIATPKIFDQKR
jgi:HEAT repeat protein